MKTNMKQSYTITDKQISYLRNQDYTFSTLIDVIGEVENYFIPDYFTALVNSVVFQAISFKAASFVWDRFVEVVGEITPTIISNMEIDVLQSCGLSRTKAQYIKNIAAAFLDKDNNTDFSNMTNEEVSASLLKIKGIGNWTVEMFLIFCLRRPNIISFGDLAIRRGIEWLYELDHELTLSEFARYKENYSPYSTVASLYLWEITLRGYLRFGSIKEIQDK